VNRGDLFQELVEHCDITAASPHQASEEFAAACRRVDKDPRERQRIADIAHLLDTEDAIYTQALSALGRGEQDTALPLLQQAAEAGIGEAAWLLARGLEEQGQAQESLTWYRRAAAAGDPRVARRMLHPLAGPAHTDGYQPASTVPGDAERPIHRQPRRLLASRWMTGIVIPATAAAAVFVVVAVVGLAGTVFSGPSASFSGPGASPRQITASHPGTSPPAGNEAAVRNQAVTWIMHQVNRAAVVACDAQVCADLASKGFPRANLLTIGPQSNNPLGAELVVATAAVRAQFRDRLASVYAPAVIAAFGSGNAKIEIRWEYPGGAKAYNAVQQSYARARKAAGALLLTSDRITFSAEAQAALRSGQIDPLLPQLLAFMVQKHPVQVVDFGDQAPGGGPASLLRTVDLATPDTAAHLTAAAFLHWIQGLVHAQRAQYRPSLSQLKLPSGQTVLRIAYRAPSPLNPPG
jgi:hypothetical protein